MPPDPRTKTSDSSAAPNVGSHPPSIIEDNEEQVQSPAAIRPTSSAHPSSNLESRRDYGTVEASDPASGTVRKRLPLVRGPSSPAIRRDRLTADENAPGTPQTPRSQRRPSAARRTSTARRQGPYRGGYFSVDDDPSEVEEDREHQHGRDRSPSDDFPRLTRTNTVRRRTVHVPQLPRVDSQEEDVDDADRSMLARHATVDASAIEDDEDADADEEDELTAAEEEAEDADLSDAESFTLKDRQLAINETHPFGIRIWKPALYKKNRSVEKNAEEDIHSSPSRIVGTWLWIFNILWTLLFGWWLAAAAAFSGLVCLVFSFEPSAVAYGRTFWGLARYLFWPFGQFVKLEQDQLYAEEDEGEGRSVSEYERWQSGDLEYGRLMFGPNVTHVGSIVGRHRNSMDSASERDSLLGRTSRPDLTDADPTSRKRRLFGRGQWTLGRIIFFIFFYFFVAPLMLSVALLCWFMVFWIPMGRVLTILFHHLRKRPLALTFHPDVAYTRDTTKPSSIILCTYRAAGLKYWKYTVDGTNIFLINFLSIVALVIIDYFFIREFLGVEAWFTSPGLLFLLGLISIIPLAYFIGQAVASISAQSSMGLGAVINAFFSTVVEVFLYCVALKQGKGRLVEGSIVGSIFAGILLLPGLSMCFGAIRRKTQRFNVKSASATSTMLLFAMIAAFGPTLFYKIYGAHELICRSCDDNGTTDEPRDCRHCYFRQSLAPDDAFFVQAVRPYCWIAAVLLFLSYVIGLLFTLRTHAAVIWQIDVDEKKPVTSAPTADVSPSNTRGHSIQASQVLSTHENHVPKPAIRDSQMYRRILGQSLRAAGLDPAVTDTTADSVSVVALEGSGVSARDHSVSDTLPHVVPPKPKTPTSMLSPEMRPVVPGLSEEENENLLRQVAVLASTAATVAARDAVVHPRQTSYMTSHSGKHDKRRPSAARLDTIFDASRAQESTQAAAGDAQEGGPAGGGHDAPNWSRTKSAAILLTATLAYAAIAEILVDTVDVILSSVSIDQKFLGMTLFALVPNTTEFLNAISFAMNGNIALSMEIGSAYVLQVALLQIPALVLFSAVYQSQVVGDLADYTFNLIFPQFDMVTVILCVFLLSYVNTEGKSNYFKGSILVMAYLVILMGFYYSGFTGVDVLGINPNDTLALTVHSWQSMSAKAAALKAEL